MLTVDDDEDDAVEFSSSNCCTCRMSTYSSSWFCDDDAADDEAAAAEISAEFGRLPLKSKKSERGKNYVGDAHFDEWLMTRWKIFESTMRTNPPQNLHL